VLETLSYFIRFLPPIALALLTVGGVAAMNHAVAPVLWKSRAADAIEVLAYSVVTAGPFVFSVSFLLFFFAIETYRDGWELARYALGGVCLLAVVTLAVEIAFIPRLSQ
jgi:hypothetical protein